MLASVFATVGLGFATGGHTWSYIYVPHDRERVREGQRERETGACASRGQICKS